MSPSSAGNGDPRAPRGEAAAAATAVRLPQESTPAAGHRRRADGRRTRHADPTDRHQRRRRPFLVKAAVFIALAALAVLLLQAFVIQPFAVPGNAMSPALQAGDRILVVKAGLLEGPVRSGEIVVFRPPRSLPCTVIGGSGGDLVLRVVALPGTRSGPSATRSSSMGGRCANGAGTTPASARSARRPSAAPRSPRTSTSCWPTTVRTPVTRGTSGPSRSRPSSARGSPSSAAMANVPRKL